MNEPARPARWRTLLVVVGVLAVVSLIGSTYLQRHPNAFDREQVNPQLVEKLGTAKFASPTVVAASWPQWRGPNRDGLAAPQPLRTNWTEQTPAKLWSVPCRGGYSTVVVADGRAYTSDYDGQHERVLAIDTATGNPAWEWLTVADYSKLKLGYIAGPRATPTIADGRLYVLGTTGTFVCLQLPKPGDAPRELWRHDLLQEFEAEMPQWGVASSPLVEGDLVIVQPGGRRGSVVAFDRVSGQRRWAAGKSPCGYSSPIATTFRGTRMILAMTGRELMAIRATDGEVLWQYPWAVQQGINTATPIVIDDYVFISSSYNKGAALLLLDQLGIEFIAKPVYFRPNKLMRNHHATCVHKDGYLYGFDNATLTCIDLRKGVRRGTRRAWEKGGLIRCGEYLVGVTERGQAFIAEASPNDFTLLGRFQALDGAECWAAPTLVDGRMYLRDLTSINCFDVRATNP